MFQRFRCCECYRVQNSSLSQQVLSKIVDSEHFLIECCKTKCKVINDNGRSEPMTTQSKLYVLKLSEPQMQANVSDQA